MPSVVVPFFADQTHNARRLADLGAGLEVDPADMARLPDVVRAVLADKSYRAAAGRIREEVDSLPAVDNATAILEAYSQPRSVAWSTAWARSTAPSLP